MLNIEVNMSVQGFPAMEKGVKLMVGTSASVTTRYLNRARMVMGEQSAICPSLALLLMAVT